MLVSRLKGPFRGKSLTKGTLKPVWALHTREGTQRPQRAKGKGPKDPGIAAPLAAAVLRQLLVSGQGLHCGLVTYMASGSLSSVYRELIAARLITQLRFLARGGLWASLRQPKSLATLTESVC